MPSPEPPADPNRRQDYKLWLWVTGAFVVLIAAWVFLIVLSREYQPAVIPLD